MITARIERKPANQQDCVILEDDAGNILLKAYPSPDLTKLRIVLPELQNFAQTIIKPDQRLIDFTRDGRAAQQELRRRNR